MMRMLCTFMVLSALLLYLAKKIGSNRVNILN